MSNFRTMSTNELIAEWTMAKDDMELASLNMSTLKKHVKDIEVELRRRGGPDSPDVPLPFDDEAEEDDLAQHIDTETGEVLDGQD